MNPFFEMASPADSLYMDWQRIYPKPYCKEETDPYTKVRIILMNGTEFEANWFKHQFHRNCPNNDLRRELAVLRRVEQQQQKRIAADNQREGSRREFGKPVLGPGPNAPSSRTRHLHGRHRHSLGDRLVGA